MTLSVIVVLSMVVDGQLHAYCRRVSRCPGHSAATVRSNWLQGYLLCAAYAVIAVLPEPLKVVVRKLAAALA